MVPGVTHLFQQLCVEQAGVGGAGEWAGVQTCHSSGVLARARSCRQGNNGQEEHNQCCPLNPGQAPPEGRFEEKLNGLTHPNLKTRNVTK